MAEAFLSELAPEHEAFSAGTHVMSENEGYPISKITEKVTQCMEEVGHSIAEKPMNLLTPEMVENLCFTPEILTEVTAAPEIAVRSTLRKAFPSV